MGRRPTTVILYECDECNLEFEAEGTDGITPAYPLGWLSINNAPTSGDMFCSWRCLGTYATRTAGEREAAAAARKAEREALKAQAENNGGVV